ncbi:MAG TPA: peptidoglycan-binding domain-containing protein [Kofleriaceae bacterium]|nr:peptidoglycan-binding domain-containing protein [Kofleriaceae bacterium]
MRTWIAAAAFVLASLATSDGRAEPCDPVPIWRDGRRAGEVCRAEAGARGLTVIDLGDDWLPAVLAPGAGGGGPSYAETYRALAEERFAEAGSDGDLAAQDRYLELYGIEPTFGVVRARLADEARHRCHEVIDDSALLATEGRIGEESRAQGIARIAHARALRAQLEHARERAKLEDFEALADGDRHLRRRLDRLIALETYLTAVRAAQGHLACDALFASPPVDAAYTSQTSDAIARFQRGAMILPSGALDDQTRDALALGSREREFRTALRVLRARVIDATGLVEDGTAGAGEGRVLGRPLEPEATWRVRGHEPLEDAAPDLISAATDAAARALGWRDPGSALAFLNDLPAPQIAVALPPAPAYHTATMALVAEIDRGDVWYDASPQWRDAERRPALIMYAIDGARRIALTRWPTTIGGWQDQKVGDRVETIWKESPVGPQVWRDLYVGPRWLPPNTTPDRELVRAGDHGVVLAREQFGPSYRAAFGFVAFLHLVEDRAHGEAIYVDQGIRTHGTGSVATVARGASHGCHRLLGMNVVRLAGFVLKHHDHVRRGDQPTYYRRVVQYHGQFPLAIDTLGYRIELIGPIPVEVLPGRIHRP